MLDDPVRDLQMLWKSDSLIGRIWLDVMARLLALSFSPRRSPYSASVWLM